MTSKLKPQGWDQLSWHQKRAAVLWPHLVPKAIQQEMKEKSKGDDRIDPLTARGGGDDERATNWLAPRRVEAAKVETSKTSERPSQYEIEYLSRVGLKYVGK